MQEPLDAGPVRRIECPRCGGPSLYAPTNPFRPFCGNRCKSMDLGSWASESFKLPEEPPISNPEIQ